MANIASPLVYLKKREYELTFNLKSDLFSQRLNVAKNLYRRDLVCHFGCVNAIEFSHNGELLISGGDDRRVMLWQFGKAIMNHGQPEALKGLHQSNIFCLGITRDNQKIFSGGNDDIVIVHDLESKCPLEVLRHQRAVCGLSIDPFNDRIVATAGNDGRLLLFDTRQSVLESLVISRSRKSFHGVMFHPQQQEVLVSANSRDGAALWDLRSPKHPTIRYVGNNGVVQNSMSVRFNGAGTLLLALRRRMTPVLYAVHSPDPIAELYHSDYYNSCTMKSCCFAGEGDQYVMSGSDDFNLYMWKVPEGAASAYEDNKPIVEPHIVLYGHRSIVNQVRYNPHYCLIASSGVEKIIKVWSALEYPQMRGDLLAQAQGPDNPREIYSHDDYVSLVHHSGQYISHNYVEQSTSEDPRMMAFFDSLVQRELECLGDGESDSLAGSSSGASRSRPSDSSDTDHQLILTDLFPLPPKRANSNGTRSQRCPNRLARLVASRYPKTSRSSKRGSMRRSKQRVSGAGAPPSPPGKRTLRRTTRLPRPAPPRVRPAPPRARPAPARARPALSAPSSERDSDDTPHSLYAAAGRLIRPLRRRMNLTRATKRKSKGISYRKGTNRSNGSTMVRDICDSNINNLENFDENLALPSTSTGYRGQSSSALFRIAEVDSDDDHSASSRPITPRNQNIPTNLISIVPTPLNGSRDSLGDSLRSEPHDMEGSPPDRHRVRRSRRNGRISIHRSDSSESPPHKDAEEREVSELNERLAPVTYNRTVARLMNETNESELESSCSTESSMWPPADRTPDSGVGTIVGSSSRSNVRRDDDLSDDPEYQALKFRQRVKKARRNYRNHMESDSN